jgi:hypothetical protein
VGCGVRPEWFGVAGTAEAKSRVPIIAISASTIF